LLGNRKKGRTFMDKKNRSEGKLGRGNGVAQRKKNVEGSDDCRLRGRKNSFR